MIRFACPKCQQTYTVPDHAGGRKGDCKKCGQRVQVPKPARRRTVLGTLMTDQLSRRSRASAGAVLDEGAKAAPSLWRVGVSCMGLAALLVGTFLPLARADGGYAMNGGGTLTLWSSGPGYFLLLILLPAVLHVACLFLGRRFLAQAAAWFTAVALLLEIWYVSLFMASEKALNAKHFGQWGAEWHFVYGWVPLAAGAAILLVMAHWDRLRSWRSPQRGR